MITLTCSSIDDEETSSHDTAEGAIAAAVAWFTKGYEALPDVDIADDVANLREDLAAGRDFFGAKFGEQVSLSS